MGTLLRDWGRYGPVAILQVLPARLWDRSGLGSADQFHLRSRSPATKNPRLLIEERSDFAVVNADIANPFPVPCIELERQSLSAWAQLIAGSSRAQVTGFELTIALQEGTKREPGEDIAPFIARERVAWFRATSTPKARELATLFAAANYLSLPVMRHIWLTMLPQATLGHLAEVFMGGILREVTDDWPASDPEYVRYDFLPGTRELLLDGIDARDAARILEQVSDYVRPELWLHHELPCVARRPDRCRQGGGGAHPRKGEAIRQNRSCSAAAIYDAVRSAR